MAEQAASGVDGFEPARILFGDTGEAAAGELDAARYTALIEARIDAIEQQCGVPASSPPTR